MITLGTPDNPGCYPISRSLITSAKFLLPLAFSRLKNATSCCLSSQSLRSSNDLLHLYIYYYCESLLLISHCTIPTLEKDIDTAERLSKF